MSDFFRNLNTHYAFYYRKVMGGRGYVFQGRFKSTIIGDDAYLKQAIVYVLQNPQRAGMVSENGKYRWSSEKLYFSGIKGKPWLDIDFVEALFGDRKAFRANLHGDILEASPLRRGPFGGWMGDPDFLEKSMDRFERRRNPQGDRRRRDTEEGFEPMEKVLMEFERRHVVKVEEIDGRTIRGKRLRGEWLVRLREIIEFPSFADVKYRSLSHLYQIAQKRFRRAN